MGTAVPGIYGEQDKCVVSRKKDEESGCSGGLK